MIFKNMLNFKTKQTSAILNHFLEYSVDIYRILKFNLKLQFFEVIP